MTIYLDNAATTWPKPESVYLAMDHFARKSMANPGRSGHAMAKASEKVLDDARVALNRFFEGASPDRWAFTLNGTDALNMAIKGWCLPGTMSSPPTLSTIASIDPCGHWNWLESYPSPESSPIRGNRRSKPSFGGVHA